MYAFGAIVALNARNYITAYTYTDHGDSDKHVLEQRHKQLKRRIKSTEQANG
jgi:hypothetical protein